MNQNNIITNIKNKLEDKLHMSFISMILFLAVLYLLIIVSRSVWGNYQSNKKIEKQEAEVVALDEETKYLENEIEYFSSKSYKEKEARSKLGYKSAGEKVLSLAQDQQEDKVADQGFSEQKIKISNPRLWWSYFFGKNQ